MENIKALKNNPRLEVHLVKIGAHQTNLRQRTRTLARLTRTTSILLGEETYNPQAMYF